MAPDDRVLGTDRAFVGVLRDRHTQHHHLLLQVLVGVDLGHRHYVETRHFGGAARTVNHGVGHLLKRRLRGTSLHDAVVDDREPQLPAIAKDGEWITRRAVDLLLVLDEVGVYCLLLREVVASTVVGEGDVARVRHREHLENQQEDEAGQDVFERDEALREVDDVGDDEQHDHRDEDAPRLRVEGREDRGKPKGVDEHHQAELAEEPPAHALPAAR